MDIRSDTLNIDENRIESAISNKTKVIIPVHYGGIASDMDQILSIAKTYGLYVLEDAAQGFNAKYKNKYLGTIGDIGAFSFHETKNCICGEGGAIVVNNDKFFERAEIIREKGTNRAKFFRGEVDKYTWVDIGSSYLPSDLLAAFLYAQLENIDIIDARRKSIFARYYKLLKPLEEKGFIKIPNVPADCQPCGHLFYVIAHNEQIRDKLIDYLRSKGIGAVFHYVPLHLSKIGKSFGFKAGDLPITEKISSRIVRLPMYYELNNKDVKKPIQRL